MNDPNLLKRTEFPPGDGDSLAMSYTFTAADGGPIQWPGSRLPHTITFQSTGFQTKLPPSTDAREECCGACDIHDHGEHAYVPICFACSKEDTEKARKALAKLRTYIATYIQAGGHINSSFHETLRTLIVEGLGL